MASKSSLAEPLRGRTASPRILRTIVANLLPFYQLSNSYKYVQVRLGLEEDKIGNLSTLM